MMDNCTLVNKLLRWHEPLPWPARGNSGCLEFVCKKLFLYVSGIREQIEARKSADIFHRKYWVWCYPNLCNIRRCYPNILSVCPVHYGQGIPKGLSSSLVRSVSGDEEQVGAQCPGQMWATDYLYLRGNLGSALPPLGCRSHSDLLGTPWPR